MGLQAGEQTICRYPLIIPPALPAYQKTLEHSTWLSGGREREGEGANMRGTKFNLRRYYYFSGLAT